MLHANRRWSIGEVENALDLAEKLTEMTWTPCQAFRVRGSPYLFANDATSPDGAQEYTVLAPSTDTHLKQIESITFSWCTQEKALRLIRRALAGEFDDCLYDQIEADRFETSEKHGRCPLCA